MARFICQFEGVKWKQADVKEGNVQDPFYCVTETCQAALRSLSVLYVAWAVRYGPYPYWPSVLLTDSERPLESSLSREILEQIRPHRPLVAEWT